MSSKCVYCERAFVNGDRKSKYNNHEYHQDCFRCSTCHQPIKQSFYNLGNNEYRCSDCQKQLDVIIKCSRCLQVIDDGSYIDYKGEPIHASCFTCHSCSQPLGNMLYVEHDSQAYCVPCHMDQFAQACAVCKRPFPTWNIDKNMWKSILSYWMFSMFSLWPSYIEEKLRYQ